MPIVRPSDTYTGQSGVDSYRPAPPPSGYQPSGSGSGDAYQQPSQGGAGDAYEPPSRGYGNSYQPSPSGGNGGYGAYNGPRDEDGGSAGYGEPYHPPQSASREEHYQSGPPPYDNGPSHGTYSEDEIIRAGNNFFGKVSGGLASAVEWAFQKCGRPNGYILGQDAGGAFVAGLAYGEGTLYTKDAGTFKVYWQGPSVGYDFGADGSKVMTLVYNLRDPSDIFDRFGGVEGAAYLDRRRQCAAAEVRACHTCANSGGRRAAARCQRRLFEVYSKPDLESVLTLTTPARSMLANCS